MVRALVALTAALVPLCLSVGDGSEAFVRVRCDVEEGCSGQDAARERADWAQGVATPGEMDGAGTPRTLGGPPLSVATHDRHYPRFLHPLPGQRAHFGVRGQGGARRHTRQILLSFDDGPDLYGTPLVLDALDRHGWKGIFFVNGRYLLGSKPQDLARRELVRKLATHGHLVANHTLTHRNLCHEPGSTDEEIDTNSEVIAYASGVRPLLFRSPYGARCRSLDQALEERDLIQVGWNLDPQEWKCEDPDAVFGYVTRRLAALEGPAILLLHDTHPAAVHALPRILDWIEAENARVSRQRDAGTPLQVVDYSVFLPERDVPPTGLEPLLVRLAAPLAALPRP